MLQACQPPLVELSERDGKTLGDFEIFVGATYLAAGFST